MSNGLELTDINGNNKRKREDLEALMKDAIVLDEVTKEGVSTQQSVKDMFDRFKKNYGETAGAPRRAYLKQDNFEQLMKTNKDFNKAAKNNPYYAGLMRARKENQGM